MPLIFSPDDLDAQARVRDAFDPSGRANPEKVLPTGQPVWRDRNASRTERVDLMPTPIDDELAAHGGRRRPAGRRRGRGEPSSRSATRRGRGRTGRRARGDRRRSNPPISPSPSAPAPPCAELDAVLASAGQEFALDPRDPAATVGGILAVGLSGPPAPAHVVHSATASSRCGSPPPTVDS